MPESSGRVDTSKWSGEGEFTTKLVGFLEQLDAIAFLRVEDAPASRAESDYNFISNEVYVAFATASKREERRRFGIFPSVTTTSVKVMTITGLEDALGRAPEIGPPDYADEAMLQYLRSERIIPPYQTKGYKLVELVRVYEVPAAAGS